MWHTDPPFAVSVGVLEKGVPVAAAVVEFAGALALLSALQQQRQSKRIAWICSTPD